jgi:hypothetical protein
MTRTLLITLAILFAAAAAVPIAAQDAVPPRFFIERIEVREAKRVSKDVVIAESRLREGQEYTEADLRDASSRLARLPFLLSAEFALEKGSERGRYVLVVTINETKPFFFALDLRQFFTRDNNIEPEYDDRIGASDNFATVGYRWFVGRRGALHAALVTSDYDHRFARDYAAAVVGYTQYDLFGTRAFATLNLKHVIAEGGTEISPQLVIGVPLSANQTLTLELDETRFGSDTDEVLGEMFDRQRGQRIAGATWSYNTTNRPFLPTRGTLLSVRPRLSWSDSATYVLILEPVPGSPVPSFSVHADTVHSQVREVSVNAARYWELSERSSVSAGVNGAYADFRVDSDFLGLTIDHELRGGVTAGYSYSFWDAERSKNGDSRLEVNARVGNRSFSYTDFYRAEQRQLSASWVRRSSWGSLRLGAGYAW